MKPDAPKKSWTFIPTKIEVASGKLNVAGNFAFMTMSYIEDPQDPTLGKQPHLDVHYLTEHGAPVTLTLPYDVLGDTRIDEMSAKDVLEKLQEMFSTPFEGVPKAPTDLPLHRIPPSKRQKIQEAAEKQR